MLSKIPKPKLALYTLLSAYASFQVYSYIKTRYIRYKLNIKAKTKRCLRDSASPNLEPIPKEIEDFVLSQSASDLAQAIRSGRITSVQAVSVYIHRAYTIGRDHCLTAEELFGPALASAHECDAELAQGKLRGPLHGVPFSVKDQFAMVGCTSSAGVIWKLDHPDQETALAVSLLVEQGAIPFVRSNVPPAMMWAESANKIYGRAQNPWDRNRTPGGSSGGEGGLVAARCSPLGIGSDIGGSLRIPAAFCGVYSFKPTPGRVPRRGVFTAFKDNFEPLDTVLKDTIGPFGRCTEDLACILRAWFSRSAFDFEPTIVPLPFNEGSLTSGKKLKIGYFSSLSIFPTATCIQNAINHCVQQLSHDCEVVPFALPELEALAITYVHLFRSNGNENLRRAFQGEEPESFYQQDWWMIEHPHLMKFIRFLLNISGSPRMANALQINANISSSELIEIYQTGKDLTEKFFKEWMKLGLDAVICPQTAIVAPFHDTTPDVGGFFIYGFIWNLLRSPSGIVPVGLLRKEEAGYEDNYDDIMTRATRAAMVDAEGMPYALQVAGLPFQDETVLRVMKKVEGVFNFHKYAL
jgi:fatty acid amide hydrolase